MSTTVRIETEEKPHAELGPSGWATWGNCPGSIALGEGIPRKSSQYAREGTAAHTLLERCLLEGCDAEDLLGAEIVVEGEVFVVDMDMADAINTSVTDVRSHIDTTKGDILHVEQTVPLQHMTGEEGAEGTCDVAGITDKGTTLVIADFKYGQGVMVYASEPTPDKGGVRPNGQLAMYADGWLAKHGFLYEEITKIKLVVLQPRMQWVDEYTLTREALDAFINDTVREAAGLVELNKQVRLEGGDLQLVPGYKQCKFCVAKGICPALRASTSTALATVAEPSNIDEFENLSLPKQAAAVVVNEGVTNERLAEFMRAIPLIEQAIDAARAETERRLFDGQEIPGFYLGVGRAGHRKWEDEELARKEITKSGRLKVADATVQKLKSPTQIEKLAKGTKWWPKVAPMIKQEPGGPSVCVEGDKNPRYQIASSVSEFENLDAQPALEDVMN
jgi:hypothetical protein